VDKKDVGKEKEAGFLGEQTVNEHPCSRKKSRAKKVRGKRPCVSLQSAARRFLISLRGRGKEAHDLAEGRSQTDFLRRRTRGRKLTSRDLRAVFRGGPYKRPSMKPLKGKKGCITRVSVRRKGRADRANSFKPFYADDGHLNNRKGKIIYPGPSSSSTGNTARPRTKKTKVLTRGRCIGYGLAIC